MADIFISYAGEDRPHITRLAAALEAEGFAVWWDREIAGGTDFSSEIEAQLAGASAIIVAWSQAAVRSMWVADEATFGRDKGNLVPISIDGVPPKIGFRQLQTIEFQHWTGQAGDEAMRQLLQAVRRRVEPVAGTASRDPAPAAPPAEFDIAALNLVRRQLTPLIGREPERATIDTCLEDVAAGRGGVLLLSGEPGVGKTRLAEEALVEAQRRGMLPLVGHAYEERGAPYIIATEIIEETMRVLPEPVLRQALGEAAPEVARFVPGLRRLFRDIPPALELPPDQQQRYLFNALLGFTRNLCGLAPTVILLDDLHWADESSIALLEHILPHLPELPLQYVITYRDVAADMGDPFRRALAGLNRQPFVRRIPLHTLSRDNVAEMLATLGGRNPPDALVATIFEETGGNAFFTQAIYQSLAEEGRLFNEDGSWRHDLDAAGLAVPDSIRLVIERRLEHLAEPVQQVLGLAAILGLRFEPEVLEQMSGLDGDAFIDAVEAAEAANLILPAAGKRETRYEFSHALVRQALLEMSSPLRRERRHLQAAAALESLFGAKPERAAEIAKHLLAAGKRADRDKTVAFLRLAGENAIAAAAADEASEYFDTALALADPGAEELRADLLRRRADVRLALGDNTGVLADLGEALDLYESLQLNEKFVGAAVPLVQELAYQARSREAIAAVERAKALIRDEETAERARLLSAEGFARSMAPTHGPMGELHGAAVALARKLGDERLLAEALMSRAFSEHLKLGGDEAAAIAAEAAALYRKLGLEWFRVNSLWMMQDELCGAGRIEESLRIMEEVEPRAERIGHWAALASSRLRAAVAQLARGEAAECLALFDRTAEAWDAGGYPWGRFDEGYRAVVLLLLGRRDEAGTAVSKLGVQFLLDANWTGADAGYWLSIKAQLGDRDILAAYREHQWKLPEPGPRPAGGAAVFLKGAIEALVVAGEREEAARLYPLIAEFVQHSPSLLDFTFGLHARFAGMAAAAAQDWPAAERHYEHALQLAEDMPHRVDQARVRYWFARMLRERGAPGDGERAGRLLDEARTLGEAMGLAGLVEAIDDLARL